MIFSFMNIILKQRMTVQAKYPIISDEPFLKRDVTKCFWDFKKETKRGFVGCFYHIYT